MKHGEAVSLSYRNSFPDIYEIENISVYLKKLKSNSTLSSKAILDLANILKLSYELKDYFNKDFLKSQDYPILSNLFFKLYTNKEIIKKIFSCILDEETIDDKASKNLLSIRKKKRSLEKDIKTKLNDMIHSPNYSKYIQENLVTMRNDRFVIPIKQEFRSHINGFVHDISNAGSTVFIEPLSVFEMNNELNTLKNEENLEIEKILSELTKLFYPYVEKLSLDAEIIGKLDFIFAKAKYSKSINGITPKINKEKYINLINARHPLINASKVVPISINIGKDFSCLLITGPNTGGKTVSLKTVGLLECMACAGLNIPASENSSIYVFDNIFVDIGDNQSIPDSLSTFSSHMLNIIDITKNANENSLILLDELGSGTDPLEGANLAISILDNFKSIGALTIATTHYQKLKKFALVTEGFKNASLEFDINNLSPTYKLLIGIPGKSNAFEISKKLGLDKKIIENAKALMSSENISFEELIKTIYDNKSIIEKEKEQISTELEKISSLRKLLEKDNSDLEKKAKDLINDAKIQAREILLDAKDEANNIIKKMNNLQSPKELNSLKNKLNVDIKSISIDDSYNIDKPLDKKDIKPNNYVFVSNFNQNGLVLSNVSKSNEVQVQIGSIKTSVNIKYLQKPKNIIAKHDVSSSYSSNVSKSKNIKTEINVMGLNSEEAIFVVDKFLDDVSLAKLSTVRIVHGKGTGKLRSVIHDFLKKHPNVKTFRIGTYGEGETGVTIVELK